jgi:hypothetical protein
MYFYLTDAYLREREREKKLHEMNDGKESNKKMRRKKKKK